MNHVYFHFSFWQIEQLTEMANQMPSKDTFIMASGSDSASSTKLNEESYETDHTSRA